MRAAVIVVVLGMGCGGSRREPVEPPSNKPAVEPEAKRVLVAHGAPSDRDFETVMGRMATMFADLAQAEDGAGTNCAKMAVGMDSVLDANDAVLAAVKRWNADPEMKDRASDWMRDHQDQVMASVMKFATAMQRCAADPQVLAVVEKLSALVQ